MGPLLDARDATTDAARLAALIEAWRVTPYPALADLVGLAGKRAARPIVLAERRADQQVQWLEIAAAREPASLDWLIEHLVTPQSGASKVRIRELATWPGDPRLATGLLGVARGKPLTSRQNRPFWTQLFRIVQAQLHAGARPLLQEMLLTVSVTEFDVLYRARLLDLEVRLAQRPPVPAPTAEDAVLLGELAAILELESSRAAEKTRDDFLREIWQTPLDDGPREVFADWLLERGDPWGELITLQIARWRQGPATTKTRRERALLDEHAHEWLGVLEPVVLSTNARFERGFLYSCKVHWRRLAAAPTLMTHPAWATLREFEIDPDGEQACDRWIDHVIALGARRR